MKQLDLWTLLNTTLTAGLTGRYGADAVGVQAIYQPQIMGAPSQPTVTFQSILEQRFGHMRRAYSPGAAPIDPMTGQMMQWWESTLQIGAMARRNPNAVDFMSLPTAMDICKAASDILQSDEGLTALAAQRVRPLRITAIRNLQWVNESDQYEAMPNFDLVLVYPQTIVTTTPTAQSIEPNYRRV